MASTQGTDTKWFGVSVDKWVMLIQTLGIPSLFMLFVCYLAWSYIPRVVDAHVELLRKTGDTLEQMDDTLKASNLTLGQMLDDNRGSKEFMKQVLEDHQAHADQLNKIEQGINHAR